MHIAINHHGARNVTVALQSPDGNRYVVDQAKALPVIGEGMVESASYMDAAMVAQGQFGGYNRPSGHIPESFHKFFTVRHFQFQFLARAQGSAFQFFYPERGMG